MMSELNIDVEEVDRPVLVDESSRLLGFRLISCDCATSTSRLLTIKCASASASLDFVVESSCSSFVTFASAFVTRSSMLETRTAISFSFFVTSSFDRLSCDWSCLTSSLETSAPSWFRVCESLATARFISTSSTLCCRLEFSSDSFFTCALRSEISPSRSADNSARTSDAAMSLPRFSASARASSNRSLTASNSSTTASRSFFAFINAAFRFSISSRNASVSSLAATRVFPNASASMPDALALPSVFSSMLRSALTSSRCCARMVSSLPPTSLASASTAFNSSCVNVSSSFVSSSSSLKRCSSSKRVAFSSCSTWISSLSFSAALTVSSTNFSVSSKLAPAASALVNFSSVCDNRASVSISCSVTNSSSSSNFLTYASSTLDPAAALESLSSTTAGAGVLCIFPAESSAGAPARTSSSSTA
mmetsp:Transcript_32291/g.78800  ORF Transcript_32291/g.78800 Transcript_32291/m.78800 type:complete len:421 (-) Transcript_32291:676-1938(-)